MSVTRALALSLPLCAAGPALAEVAPAAPALAPRIYEIPAGPLRTRRTFRLSFGGAYRAGFGSSLLGAALELGMGVEDARWGGAGLLHFEMGRTLGGLVYQAVKTGPLLEARIFNRLRWGGGVDVGALVIQRATSYGGLWSLMVGGHVDGSVDLWQPRSGGGLYVGARVGVDLLTSAPEPAMLMTTLSLGYRS